MHVGKKKAKKHNANAFLFNAKYANAFFAMHDFCAYVSACQ